MPPRARIASLAPSREKSTSEPVTTRVRPSRVRSVDSSRSSSMRHVGGAPTCRRSRGASRSARRTTRDRLRDRRADALGGRELLEGRVLDRAAIEPNSVASARAAVGPTCRIDSADQHPPQRPLLGARRGCRAAAARWPRAPATSPSPFLGARVNRSVCSSLSSVEVEDVALVGDHARASSSAYAASEPSPSMSNEPRPATWKTRSSTCDRQNCVVGAAEVLVALLLLHQRRAAGRARRWASSTSCRPFGRRPSTGPTISGITSPALRSTTVSPGRTSLRCHLVGVVQRGPLDGRARDPRRLHHPERRDPAGAAGVDLDRDQLGVDLLGRVLERDRPARRPRRRPEPALQRRPRRP